MIKAGLRWGLCTLLAGALFTQTAIASDDYFEVKVTNITRNMVFTPIMVASVKEDNTIFKLGSPASAALEVIAETGDPSALQESIDALEVTNSSFLPFLEPGQSVTQRVATEGRYDHVSVAAMLIPTNDVFFGANAIEGPGRSKGKGKGKGKDRDGNDEVVTVTVRAYDAGTEINDELCASLPGPGCGGDPGPDSDGEGYVYVSPGIRGGGDLDSAALDWKNPVALIEIRRVSDR